MVDMEKLNRDFKKIMSQLGLLVADLTCIYFDEYSGAITCLVAVIVIEALYVDRS